MKIIHHVELSIKEISTKDVSGYSAKDDVPHLKHDLNEFAQLERSRLSQNTSKPVKVERMWTTLE